LPLIFFASCVKEYVGSDNQLYFPTAALVINSFRGYFVLGSSLQPGAASINEP